MRQRQIDWTMPTLAICINMELEPKLINGSGMPVIGMSPMHMPMFSRIWNNQMPTMPTATSRRNCESDRYAMRIVEKMSSA